MKIWGNKSNTFKLYTLKTLMLIHQNQMVATSVKIFLYDAMRNEVQIMQKILKFLQ